MILFILSEDWYFLSHYAPLAYAWSHTGTDQGYEITVATHCTAHKAEIEKLGYAVVELPNLRSGRLRDLWTAWRILRRLYRKKPEHNFSLATYPFYSYHIGWPAMLLSLGTTHRKSHVLHVIAGMGSEYLARSFRWRMVYWLLQWKWRRARQHVLVQNPDDAALIRSEGLQPIQWYGCGVDTTRFTPSPEPDGPITILYAGRLVRDKGIGDFVEAAHHLQAYGFRWLIVGRFDATNPSAVDFETVRIWTQQGWIEYRGVCDRMADLLASVHLVVIPSYREGLPKLALEAGACGRPVIARDVPGCREVIRHNQTGLLVQTQTELEGAILTLATDAPLRARFGAAARAHIESCFAQEQCVADHQRWCRWL